MTDIPAITIGQMKEVDRIMIDEIGVSVLVMMENAARNIAVHSRTMLGGSVKGKKIVILAGKGNNGGDGMGAARHLINYGAYITILLSSKPDGLGEYAQIQYEILKNTNAQIYTWESSNHETLKEMLCKADLLIDALLGFNLKGNPRDPIASMIKAANDSKAPILAVDIPSGLEGNTGKPHSPTIIAHSTLTLALPKTGLLAESAREYVGELYIGDISVPKNVYDKLGIEVPLIFEHQEIVKVRK